MVESSTNNFAWLEGKKSCTEIWVKWIKIKALVENKKIEFSL